MKRRLRSVLLGNAMVLMTAAAFAAVLAVEPRGYSVMNPTPRAALRELSTDRPDQTESPHTVNAGHVQLEMDFLNYTKDRDRSAGGDVRTEIWSFAPVNLKVGLFDHVDVQLMVDPRVESRVKDRGANTLVRSTGFGDVTTRLKVNFWGNDGGSTAFAMMPFVKWPLSASDVRNGKTEGGIIFPFGMDLPAGWGLGAMTEVDFLSDGTGGREIQFVNSVTVARDLTSRLGGYVELFTVRSREAGSKWQVQFDVGFTYAVTPDTQLDFGCNFGVTKSAPDLQPFAGISRRF